MPLVSETDEGARHWRLYVRDMIEFGERVIGYAASLDQQSFTADQIVYDATLRNIELIGEAATHIPEPVRDAHPEIQWRQIVGVRNQVAHGYLGIDDDTIWSIIQTSIPDLLAALRGLLEEEQT
ncbi:MAG: DUF86 domain-containing protein [Dehalococcoidia bacterium]|nr:DUF86 domain-containing protein [Dehalococcoidia bacterium]